MATTRVPAAWMQRHDLPRRCARHDVPSTHLDKRDFHTRTPPWVLLTIFIGVLLVLILALVLRTTIKGALPACGQCRRDRSRFLQYVWAGWIVTVVGFAAAIGTGSGALLLLGCLLLLAAIVVSCCGDRFRVTGFVSKDKAWVELKGVGPDFARIVDEALRPHQQVAQHQVAQPHADLPPVAAAYLARQQVASAHVEPYATQAAVPSAPPQLSPDGHWWWNGTQWVAAAEASLSQA